AGRNTRMRWKSWPSGTPVRCSARRSLLSNRCPATSRASSYCKPVASEAIGSWSSPPHTADTTATCRGSCPSTSASMSNFSLSTRKDLFWRAMGSFLWRIQDNAHWNRIAATAQVLREMKEFGPAYARQVVTNSRVLASQLDKWGLPVKFASQGYSASHQIHVDLEALKEKWRLGPADFADRPAANNLTV